MWFHVAAMNRNLIPLSGFLFILVCANLDAAEKNIIFFITDDEGRTLGCYGDSVAVTPRVDRLASDGTVFLNAFATTASCRQV